MVLFRDHSKTGVGPCTPTSPHIHLIAQPAPSAASLTLVCPSCSLCRVAPLQASLHTVRKLSSFVTSPTPLHPPPEASFPGVPSRHPKGPVESFHCELQSAMSFFSSLPFFLHLLLWFVARHPPPVDCWLPESKKRVYILTTVGSHAEQAPACRQCLGSWVN